METLNQMILQHNQLGGAQLTVNPSCQGQGLVDLYRNGRVVLSAVTEKRAIDAVSVLERAKRQDIEDKITDLESLLEEIRHNDDCLYEEDVKLEIEKWMALLKGSH